MAVVDSAVWAVIAALTCLVAPSTAYPYYWTDPAGNFFARAAPACTQHPSNSQWGGHPGTQPDSAIAVTLTAGGVSAGTTVCPGQTYSMTVSWGAGTRRALVTSTYGTFASASSGNSNLYYSQTPSLNCPNRLVVRRMVTSVSDSITFPCGITGTNQFQVSSADDQTAPISQATATFTVDPACGVGACAPPAVSPSPSASPPRTATLPPPALSQPPTLSSPPPTSLPPPSSITPTLTPSPLPTTSPTPSPTPSPAPTGCTPSSLNYTCSTVMGGVTVHYSIAGNIPVNPCTASAGGTLPQGYNSGAGLLHMAVEAPSSGYVGFGFASKANVMQNGDYILGWMNGDQPYANSYYADAEDLADVDIRPWAVHKSAARVNGNLVVCFTRPLTSNDATVAKTIDPTQNLIFNWAVSPVTGYVEHRSQGGGTLNLASGQTQETENKKNKNIRIHGALMSAAFALLLPLGALFPCHRWVLGNAKLGGVHVWFRAHVLVQCAGVALATVGFAWAWVYLGDPGDTQGTVGDTHKILGIIVYALMCLQLVGGFFRPPLDSKVRPLFTHGHRWAGRITILGSWVVIYLGIYLYHKGIYQAKYLPWIIPVAASMGALLLVDVGLTFSAFSKGAAPGREVASNSGTKTDNTTGFDDVQLAMQRPDSRPPTGPGYGYTR